MHSKFRESHKPDDMNDECAQRKSRIMICSTLFSLFPAEDRKCVAKALLEEEAAGSRLEPGLKKVA